MFRQYIWPLVYLEMFSHTWQVAHTLQTKEGYLLLHILHIYVHEPRHGVHSEQPTVNTWYCHAQFTNSSGCIGVPSAKSIWEYAWSTCKHTVLAMWVHGPQSTCTFEWAVDWPIDTYTRYMNNRDRGTANRDIHMNQYTDKHVRTAIALHNWEARYYTQHPTIMLPLTTHPLSGQSIHIHVHVPITLYQSPFNGKSLGMRLTCTRLH